MADRSAIEWTEATWNPLRGCSRVSAGCQHCYAERVAARFSGPGQPYEGLIHPSTRGWNGTVRLVPEMLDQPLRWKRPRRIFVNSMSDLFHESVSDNTIAAIFAVMACAPQHTFQVLTKRPARARQWFATMMADNQAAKMHESLKGAMGYHHPRRPAVNPGPWPLPNVWLGVSVENQAAADERIPLLLECPTATRWLSCEPLLGRVDLCESLGMWWNATMQCFESTGVEFNRHRDGGYRIGWVVAGGESGADARPMHPDWTRALRDQCAAAGVPFFFKQWGNWVPAEQAGCSMDECYASSVGGWVEMDGAWSSGENARPERLQAAHVFRVGKKLAGRLLDDIEHDAYPPASMSFLTNSNPASLAASNESKEGGASKRLGGKSPC